MDNLQEYELRFKDQHINQRDDTPGEDEDDEA